MKHEDYQLVDFLLNESFQQYVLNNAPEDAIYWEAWINDRPNLKDTLNTAKEIITFIATRKVQPKHQSVSDEIYQKLQKQILAETNQSQKRTEKIRLRYYWYAASIILVIGLALIWKSNNRNNKPSTDLAGRYLEVLVPVGQRSQLVLADGTKVWLNSGSTLRYPAEFLKNKREVYIEGEAFFDVTHNQHLPFIVHMKEHLSIKVFGTQFNVKSYAEDKVIETTLVKGMISLVKEDEHNHILQEIKVKPNEKATYQKNNLKLVVRELEINTKEEVKTPVVPKKVIKKEPLDELELITAWKDDELVFHNETFEDISIKMERWFGMKIEITDDDLKQERFTGKFVNKETIYQILDIFNRSEPIHYSTNNKEIVISRKKVNFH